MANHVQGYLSIRTISEEGQKVWDSIIANLESHMSEGDYEVHLGHHIFADFDNDWDFNRMCDEIGAKWAYAQDMDECGMSMYSAWSPCLEFAESVAKQIGEVDPSVSLVLTYEDEFPNFVGIATFNVDGMDTDNCIEDDELVELIRGENSDLAALWDEDNMEWTDEDAAWELLNDIRWDYIHEWQADNEEWSVV